jgi:hypothetical protein
MAQITRHIADDVLDVHRLLAGAKLDKGIDLNFSNRLALDLHSARARIAELETHERQRIAQLEEQYRIHTANTREWKEALDKQATRIAELEAALQGRTQFCGDCEGRAKRVEELEREREQARAVLFAYGEANEMTAHPYWLILHNGNLRADASVLAGPFFSRQAAAQHLSARRYEYGDKAYVFCFSGHKSHEYKALRDLLKEPNKPQDVAAIDAAKGEKG